MAEPSNGSQNGSTRPLHEVNFHAPGPYGDRYMQDHYLAKPVSFHHGNTMNITQTLVHVYISVIYYYVDEISLLFGSL